MAPEQILAALQKLDVNNDAHWTQDGLPRLDTVKLFAADQSLTRESITSVAADFTRLNAYNAQQAALNAPAAAPAPAAPEAQAAAPAQAPPVKEPAPVVAPPAAPAPTVELPAVEEEKAPADTSPKTALDEAKAELEGVQAELADVERYLTAALKHKQILQTRADDLIVRIDRDTPKHSNQHDIQSYLASQQRGLALRAQKIRSLEGIDIRQFLPSRSPIDTALARKTGYGQKRPGT